MASKIFEQILYRQISQFVGIFSEDSSIIFKDEKNKLIHPGEYGKYREEECKVLLRLILDKHVNISDGFVITADNKITTQCDVIIYNADIAPIVADGISRMFPAEEVRMIGEIKSTLSKSNYIGALRKMAENKRIIMEGRRGNPSYFKGNESKVYDTVISFLVCNKLPSGFDKLTNEEIYGDIDKKYWHNIILSLEDAAIGYFLRFEDFSQKVKEEFKKNAVNVNTVVSWQYPVFTYKKETFSAHQNIIHVKEDEKYAHIKYFCSCIATSCQEVWEYSYDPVVYLGLGIKSIFEEG